MERATVTMIVDWAGQGAEEEKDEEEEQPLALIRL